MPDAVHTDGLRETPTTKTTSSVISTTHQDGTHILAGQVEAAGDNRIGVLAGDEQARERARNERMTEPVDPETHSAWLIANGKAPQISTCIDAATIGTFLPKAIGREITMHDFLASQLDDDQMVKTKKSMVDGHLGHQAAPLLPETGGYSHPNADAYRVTDGELQRLWTGAKITTGSLVTHFADWAEHTSDGTIVLPPLTGPMPNFLSKDTDPYDAESYLLDNAGRSDAFLRHPAARPYIQLLLSLTTRTFETVDPLRNPVAAELAKRQRRRKNTRHPPDAIELALPEPREGFKTLIVDVMNRELEQFQHEYPTIPLPANIRDLYLASFIEGYPAPPDFTYSK